MAVKAGVETVVIMAVTEPIEGGSVSETSKRKFDQGDYPAMDTLRPGARVRDCEGDPWFKAADGMWVCELEDEPSTLDSADLITCYGPLTRIRAMRAVKPDGDS
jgi:hypothetical protein